MCRKERGRAHDRRGAGEASTEREGEPHNAKEEEKEKLTRWGRSRRILGPAGGMCRATGWAVG